MPHQFAGYLKREHILKCDCIVIMVRLDEHGHFRQCRTGLKAGRGIIGSLLGQGDPAFKNIQG